MPIKLHNTLTRKKEVFKPLKKGLIHMYVCGPTVYDLSHLGHARSYIAFDVIRRYLEYSGYQVIYVNNFTDIDDKILKRAEETGEKPIEITNKFIDAFYEDMDSLGIKRSTHYPRVTEVIPEIIEFVQKLIDKEYAYVTEDGVYYRVAKFKGYEKLSHQKREDLLAGARIKVDENKENPEDFALWKTAKEEGFSWDSPWGRGRPGWHIECSVMSTMLLGATFDIHGGGQDLIFPHHTNEIAQSEACTGVAFAKYWMHNGFVTIDKEKMSKSLGNFFTVREILEKYEPEVVRFFLLSTHYRSPIDFSDAHLKEAKASLERIHTAIENIKHALKAVPDGTLNKEDKETIKSLEAEKYAFKTGMDDDFNTPAGLASIFNIVSTANKYIESKKAKSKVLQGALDILEELGAVLNLFQPKNKEVSTEVTQGLLTLVEDLEAADEVESKTFDDLMDLIITLRERARTKKDYATADKIRDSLKKVGITLEDTDSGVKWKAT